MPLARRVAPFGDPGIKERSPLPRAYRSVPRPSSPLSAKASTRCPSLTLDPKCYSRNTLSQNPPHTGTSPATRTNLAHEDTLTSLAEAFSRQPSAISRQPRPRLPPGHTLLSSPCQRTI